jgi:alpha-L-fucosidase
VSEAFTKHYRLSAVMTPYTEWYWNAIRVPESPSAAHHRERWKGRPYEDFRADFAKGLEGWDPADWARLFRRAGARYVVLVTKHHDGWCLWPSRVANPHQEGWSCRRDLVGELADAVRAEGLRFGVYYSGGIDWTFNRTPVRTLVEFIGSVPGGDYPAYAEAQVRELVERYAPSVLWNDIAWPTSLGPMLRLMADYYEAVPEGVVNDRWMHAGPALRLLRRRPLQRLADALLEWRITRAAARGEYTGGVVPPPPAHYDFRTPEYTRFERIQRRKWEATRGMSASFGYNRGDADDDYASADELLHGFLDAVSKNGNLLLNVGPRGEDAAIPDAQRARLEALGRWLAHSGEAVYATRPWRQAEGRTHEGLPVRFSARGETLYATVLGRSAAPRVTLALPEGWHGAPQVRRLRDGEHLVADATGGALVLPLGDGFADEPAHAFALGPPPA